MAAVRHLEFYLLRWLARPFTCQRELTKAVDGHPSQQHGTRNNFQSDPDQENRGLSRIF